MSTEQYISVRETAQTLGITEKTVMDLIEERKLQAYKIANKFLRLKKSDVIELRNSGKIKNENVEFEYTPQERIRDFFSYNNFYFFCAAVIIFLLVVIIYL